jgi:hypothetical protein
MLTLAARQLLRLRAATTRHAQREDWLSLTVEAAE